MVMPKFLAHRYIQIIFLLGSYTHKKYKQNKLLLLSILILLHFQEQMTKLPIILAEVLLLCLLVFI